MKKTIILLALAVTLFSCSEEIVEISLADQIAGNFEASSFTFRGQKITLPINLGSESLAFDLEIRKRDELTVDLSLITIEIVQGSQTTDTTKISDLKLVETMEGEIQILENGSQLGTYNNNIIKFDLVQNDEKSTFEAIRKQ
jgi:hypothetical protein